MFKNLWIHEAQPYVISAAKRDTVAAALVESVPLLSRPPLFRTSQTVSNRHTNTIYGAMRTCPEMPYKREMFESPLDGGVIALDVCESNSPPLGTALILPGLASHSRSPYIAFFVREMCSRGWRCVVLNARGMGDAPLTTTQTYSACWTRDVRDVARHLTQNKKSDDGPTIGVGFSLGANILVKYLGEEGAATPLQAGVSICNPWDLLQSSRWFYAQTSTTQMYLPTLLRGLKDYVCRHRAVFDKLSDVDVDAALRCTTIRQFDDFVTVPSRNGLYRDAEEYYEKASSVKYLPSVEVPLFVLDATDDPIVGHIVKDSHWAELVSKKSNIYTVRVNAGGHLGFVDEHVWNDSKNASSWSDRFIAELLSQYVENVLLKEKVIFK
eukprot:PhM_4_TR279/c0_g1_i3/m.55712/K13696/ABHD1_3; abhydrolase domain-containing protein 1/3